MIEGLSLEALINLTPASLLGLVVIMLLLGKIVPRSALDDKQLEADRWHQAYEAEKASRILAEDRNAQVLEVAKTSNAVLDATFGAGRKEPGR